MSRRATNVDDLLPSYRLAVFNFIERAPLEESSLIMDGPGIGCTSHSLVLALLGSRRLCKLRAAHFFSSSGYGAFFFDAKERHQLIISGPDVLGWNQRNQRRHRIKPIVTMANFLGKRLMGRPWVFRNHLLADALRSTVSDEYASAPVQSLPANHHFWTYDTTAKEFSDIHATSRYSHWTPAEVIKSLVAFPGIYEPFDKEGHVYIDAMRVPGISSLFHELRRENRNVLFWHMGREGRDETTTFVKGHTRHGARTRLAGDFTRFLLGMGNPEFDRAIELSLFNLSHEQEAA